MRSQRTGIIQLWWRWMRKMRWVFVFARNWADPLGLGARRTEKSEFRWVNGGESRAERRKLEMGFGEMSWRRWIQKPLHGFFGEVYGNWGRWSEADKVLAKRWKREYRGYWVRMNYIVDFVFLSFFFLNNNLGLTPPSIILILIFFKIY